MKTYGCKGKGAKKYGYPIFEEDFQKDVEKEMQGDVEDTESFENQEELEETKEECKNKENNEEKESFFKRKFKKFAGMEPTFMEKLSPLISEEDIAFLKKDMKANAILTFSTYILGFVLFFVCVFTLKWMWTTPIVFAILFGQLLTSTFWKGRYWCYVIDSYRAKKIGKHKSVEELAEEIPELKNGTLKPPIKIGNITIFCIVIAIGLYIAF